LAALATLAGWLACLPREREVDALRPAWQALAAARRNGLTDVALHAAGLSPLLYGLGGAAAARATVQRLARLKEQWAQVSEG
jgi:hypothetical protein